MSSKYEVLRIRIWRMEVEDTASTMEYSALCHGMTPNFARDEFFNKDHMKNLCLARRRLHSKEHRLNDLRDHLSFPELDRIRQISHNDSEDSDKDRRVRGGLIVIICAL